MPFLLVLKAFLDCILMRAGEGSEDQLPSVWVAGMDGQVIALSDNVDNTLNVAEFDVRVDTLRVVVQSEIDEVDVPCALPLSKKAAFYAISSARIPSSAAAMPVPVYRVM
jgi:hypothetical protein